jgi:hypothetical protein
MKAAGDLDARKVEQLAVHMSSEFRALPGMRLTVAQGRRLWTAAPDEFAEAVALLVARSVLRRHGDKLVLNESRPV